jgi:hypothetical protein
MRSVSVWEAIFMLVVLKVPMVYLAAVVWWAIRAEPRADEGGADERSFVPLTPCGWDEWRRSRVRRLRGRRPLGPGGRPVRLRPAPQLRAGART